MNTENIRKIYESGLVRDFAVKSPHWRNTLERLGIDSCCGSGVPLRLAAEKAGVSLETLEKELLASEAGPGFETQNGTEIYQPDWRRASNGLLTRYILELHHAVLREEFPGLETDFERVLKVHHDHADELEPLATEFQELKTDVLAHLNHEEATALATPPKVESVELETLENEHSATGARLRTMERLTSGYKIPAYACKAVERLFRGLKRLDAGLHEHIWLENNILFPRLKNG